MNDTTLTVHQGDRPTVPATRPPAMKETAWMVLRRLTQGPACAEDFWHDLGHMQRQAARIYELIHDHGYAVDKRPCERHSHQARVYEYYLAGA